MASKFESTAWSVIAAAKDPNTAVVRSAMETLCQTYWPPIYAYLRRKGHRPEAAQDLTQEFFFRLISRDFLQHVDKHRGRFRSFLLACLNNFVSDEWDKEKASKRGGDAIRVALDVTQVEERFFKDLSHEADPTKAFDSEWAETLLDAVLGRLQSEYRGEKRSRLFDSLRGYLGGSSDPPSYETAAAELGVTEGAVRMAVHRMRVRFAELTRQAIAETVENDADVEEELNYLIGVISA